MKLPLFLSGEKMIQYYIDMFSIDKPLVYRKEVERLASNLLETSLSERYCLYTDQMVLQLILMLAKDPKVLMIDEFFYITSDHQLSFIEKEIKTRQSKGLITIVSYGIRKNIDSFLNRIFYLKAGELIQEV